MENPWHTRTRFAQIQDSQSPDRTAPCKGILTRDSRHWVVAQVERLEITDQWQCKEMFSVHMIDAVTL